MAYALNTNREIISIFQGELDHIDVKKYSSLLVIASPEILGVKWIQKMNTLVKMDSKRDIKIPWGVITANSEAELLGLLDRNNKYRSYIGNSKDLFITTEVLDFNVNDNNLEYINPNIDLDNYKEVVKSINHRNRSNITMMDVHGRQYCCAMHPKHEFFAALCSSADIYKSCGTCGLNFKCYAPPEIIRVDIAEMNTNILFLATCHGITFSDGILPMDMGLALKFVSKSGIACISSYTILSYNAEHIMGFYYLYQSGMPLGECVRLTNNLIISKLGVNAPYVLLGDPIICNNYTTSNRVHIESINEQANYGKSYSLKYPFDSNDLLVKIDKVNTIDEVNQFKKILKEQFGYHDLLELRNFLTDDLYNGFEKLLKRIKTTRNNYSKVIMGFYDALKILHLEALKKLTKEAGAGKWFYEYYIHDYEINGEKTIRVECPNCNSPSDLVTYDCIYEQYMNRFTILCPKCGIVRDFNIIDSKIDLNIQLNLDNNKADEVLISKLQISNTGDKSEFISIMPVVYLNPSAIKEDMIHQFLLKAGEVKTIEVAIHLSSLTETLHYLRVFSFVDLKLNWYNIPFLVRL